VIDIRNFGLMAGIELEPAPGKPGARAYQAFLKCFQKGLMIRVTGDIIALSPPLIISPAQIDEIAGTLGAALRELA
jgi:beta-alanine--pyruvate transaminase